MIVMMLIFLLLLLLLLMMMSALLANHSLDQVGFWAAISNFRGGWIQWNETAKRSFLRPQNGRGTLISISLKLKFCFILKSYNMPYIEQKGMSCIAVHLKATRHCKKFSERFLRWSLNSKIYFYSRVLLFYSDLFWLKPLRAGLTVRD